MARIVIDPPVPIKCDGRDGCIVAMVDDAYEAVIAGHVVIIPPEGDAEIWEMPDGSHYVKMSARKH